MVNVVCIVLLSCAYSGMFSGTGLLAPVTSRVGRLAGRIGLFGAHIAVSLGCCALFCNQTVGIVMSAQLLEEEYQDRPPTSAIRLLTWRGWFLGLLPPVYL